MKSPDFAPSVFTRRLMDESPMSLSWRGEDVKAWQRKLRRKLRALVGMRSRTPGALKVRSLWKRPHKLGTIEKIVFTAEPGADVMAYVCLPHDVEPPYDFFICVQGHSTGAHVSIAKARDDNTKVITTQGGRDFGLECMRRGLAALCIEQVGFGERRETIIKEVQSTDCHDGVLRSIMLGTTFTGQRVRDVDCGIDYLAARGDVNMKRIGVMGNSSGGTTSVFAAALLPRLAFAMPSCYFCSFRDSIMSIHHCSCNYVPGLMQYAEMWDVMGLFAPRPVVLVAGKEDDIFPIKAVRRAFKNLKSIYAAAGAEQNCVLTVGPAGHQFYPEQAWPKMLKLMR
jgi:Abhydrolase family